MLVSTALLISLKMENIHITLFRFLPHLLCSPCCCDRLRTLQLEDFLIANRDEYLRHSAMNYTSQQRQYNNRLTERLLELAARHGYVFDEEDFGECQGLSLIHI